MGVSVLATFAEAVGDDGPVACVGGRTQWHVGATPTAGAAEVREVRDVREVRAPASIVRFTPEEMTVECGAGIEITELQACLAERGQSVALAPWPGATVGGVLAVGHSGVTRLGHGPVRDALLQARVVTADAKLVKAGGPTVKNVTGYDLCRLLVGSLGTLAFIGEVILRTRPLPPASRWYVTDSDPFALFRSLYRPTSLLWDGTRTWVCLEGHPRDLDEQAACAHLAPTDGPPPLPPHRCSLAPSRLAALSATAASHGRFVAEIGVGIVHGDGPMVAPPPAPAIVALHTRLKSLFDPSGRLNPGRSVLVAR